MKDQKTKDEFLKLRVQGVSFSRIAEKLNVSKQTLINWSKQLSYEISNLKTVELETLYEKHFLTKQNQIENFGKILKNINAELEKRNVSELSTKDLYNLMIKVNAILQKEKTKTIFKEEKDAFPLNFDESKTGTWEA